MIETIHIRDAKEGDYYCGRDSSFKPELKLIDYSILGNPFAVNKTRTREQSIEEYTEWLRRQWRSNGPQKSALLKLTEIARKRNIRLVCFCKPLACHTDVIKQAVDNLLKR